MKLTALNKSATRQTINEAQFDLLDTIQEEYTNGFLALNSLGPLTVTFYGGHRVTVEDKSYIGVYEMAKMFSKRGFGIISGGGPGIMEAALKGALETKGKAIAFKIDIKNEPITLNPDLVLTFSQFSVRQYMLRQSDCFVFAPGGVGTLYELMEILTLMKTDKYPIKPIFLYSKDFWKDYIAWFEKVLLNEHNTITSDFMNLFSIVDSVEEIEQAMFKI